MELLKRLLIKILKEIKKNFVQEKKNHQNRILLNPKFLMLLNFKQLNNNFEIEIYFFFYILIIINNSNFIFFLKFLCM